MPHAPNPISLTCSPVRPSSRYFTTIPFVLARFSVSESEKWRFQEKQHERADTESARTEAVVLALYPRSGPFDRTLPIPVQGLDVFTGRLRYELTFLFPVSGELFPRIPESNGEPGHRSRAQRSYFKRLRTAN